MRFINLIVFLLSGILMGCDDGQAVTLMTSETSLLSTNEHARLVSTELSLDSVELAINSTVSLLNVDDVATLDFSGVYSLGAPIYSEIFITTPAALTNQWQVQFYAKGNPNDAAGTGADCYFVTQGTSIGSTITVFPIPFETEWYAVDEDQIDSSDRFDLVLYQTGQAEVTGYTSQCGLRVYAAGNYQQIDTTQSLYFAHCNTLQPICEPR